MISPIETTTHGQARILHEIARERDRQDVKWGAQHHPHGTSLSFVAMSDEAKRRFDATSDPTWQMILDEEVLEAFSETDVDKLRAELVQVAAVAVAWLEDIDRTKAKESAPNPPGAPYPVGRWTPGEA